MLSKCSLSAVCSAASFKGYVRRNYTRLSQWHSARGKAPRQGLQPAMCNCYFHDTSTAHRALPSLPRGRTVSWCLGRQKGQWPVDDRTHVQTEACHGYAVCSLIRVDKHRHEWDMSRVMVQTSKRPSDMRPVAAADCSKHAGMHFHTNAHDTQLSSGKT